VRRDTSVLGAVLIIGAGLFALNAAAYCET
jgi:hypothetical protein